MHYNQFGRTGLFVSELCLGTMTFGQAEGNIYAAIGHTRQHEADRILGSALDAGINFIDTANVYSTGQSETILGQALKALSVKREDVVIATKVLGRMGDGPNDAGLSRRHILDQVKASLKRMRIDHIDLYQLHGWDAATPIEESLRALDDLVRQGHVRYIGVSNWAAWQITKALGISERMGLARFDSLQAYYSLAGRALERELVPMMESERVGLMVWSPLAGGFLSGKYSREGAGDGRRASFDYPPVDKEHAFAIIEAMRPMANARGVSVAQIAIAWLLAQEVVTSVIIGARRIDQLEDNIAATKVVLSAEELVTLDSVSALTSEYPEWSFAMQRANRSAVLSSQRPAVGSTHMTG
ncbi:aldo/keto reductase [Amycolatopsis pigmentata]|uniref:Aldo/keto reductase n=1 Tax=Amycolatopsis pigmentata TaxID=450801 RepID=A0ABW5G4G4_9PSEU